MEATEPPPISPLRPEFLAQVAVPRDMKADETRRLPRFLMSLEPDRGFNGF